MSFFLSRDPVTGASAVVLCTKASSGDLLYIGPQYTRSWDLSCFSKPLYKNTEAFYNNIGFLFVGPYNKDPTIQGTTLGSAIFGNPYI